VSIVALLLQSLAQQSLAKLPDHDPRRPVPVLLADRHF
jgi:hypothetical protein